LVLFIVVSECGRFWILALLSLLMLASTLVAAAVAWPRFPGQELFDL
jgi:hypothetical protein